MSGSSRAPGVPLASQTAHLDPDPTQTNVAQRGAPVDAESQRSSTGSERIAAHKHARPCVRATRRTAVAATRRDWRRWTEKRCWICECIPVVDASGPLRSQGRLGCAKDRQIKFGTKFAVFCVYPLGFIARRSYDGGLPIFRRELRFVTERSESDEDACIGAPSVTFVVREGVIARCGVDEGLGAYQSGAGEENENNLRGALDKGSMHPHNRQFSTEGCPSG